MRACELRAHLSARYLLTVYLHSERLSAASYVLSVRDAIE
jgi:hypothetical protein